MGFREDIGPQVPDDRVVLHATDRHRNPHGTVHGGVLATMIDVAMGTAVAAGSEGPPVTVALTVMYLEPGQPGRVEAVARVRKRGRRLTIVEAEVQQGGAVFVDALATFATPTG